MDIALWIVQGLLALVFLLVGVVKSVAPLESLKKNMTWIEYVAPWQARFIGIAEVLGAIGLIAPKLTGILPQLTIAAAIGLVIVMVGAIVYHGRRKEYSAASATIVLFLLAAFVAVGYLVWVPIA
jgi:putative oxidoreductase